MRSKESIAINQVKENSAASIHFDMIRGVAAVCVLIFHLRWRLFEPVELSTALERAFHLLTGFGHEAVVIFFVLSGYFISASVLRDVRNGRWSWKQYLVNRGVRLYVVLIPGLLLTAAWDLAGGLTERLDISTLLGNLFFLQTFDVPGIGKVATYGSNRPLWSLAYEFWYYMLFPCIWHGLFGRRRIVHLAAAALIIVFLPRIVVAYFPVWLLGTALALAPAAAAKARWTMFLAALSLLGVTLAMSYGRYLEGIARIGSLEVGRLVNDWLIGIAFVPVAYLIIHWRPTLLPAWYTLTARRLGGYSYTLYVCHHPILVFLAGALSSVPWAVNGETLTSALLISIGIILYAWVLGALTEAHTPKLRDAILKRAPKGATTSS